MQKTAVFVDLSGTRTRVADLTEDEFERLEAQVLATNSSHVYDEEDVEDQFPKTIFATTECAVVLLHRMARDELRVVENLDIESLVPLYIQFLQTVCDLYRIPGPLTLGTLADAAVEKMGLKWWALAGLTDRAEVLFRGRDDYTFDFAYGYDVAMASGFDAIGLPENEDALP